MLCLLLGKVFSTLTMVEGITSISTSAAVDDPIVILGEEEDLKVKTAGVVNQHQAKHHRQLIQEALQDFKRRINSGNIKAIMKQLMEEI